MERLRILTAAVALSEFTVAELCAYSGANESTVRSVLQRDSELLERLDSQEQSGAGRPRGRYRVRDTASIRHELRQFEQNIEMLGAARLEQLPPETTDDRLAALIVAEDTVVRAWDADADGHTRRALAETALESAAQANPPGQGSSATDDELRARAASVSVLADLALRETTLSASDLARANDSLSRLVDVLAPDRLQRLLAAFGRAVAGPRATAPPSTVDLPDDAIYTTAEVEKVAIDIRDRHQVMALA